MPYTEGLGIEESCEVQSSTSKKRLLIDAENMDGMTLYSMGKRHRGGVRMQFPKVLKGMDIISTRCLLQDDEGKSKD